ncbi:MAG: nucleoside/nucleotide kinase family protein [Pseudomonadota bacterium]
MKTFDALIDHLLSASSGSKRIIFAVAGPPGAGKSTAAELICEALNRRGAKSRVVPMDGFHFDNQILGPRDLLSRKGAPETFDALGLGAQMARLAARQEDVAIPVFDRDRDLAIAGADIVAVEDDILIVEGNYLLLADEPWASLVRYWTDSILINPGMDVLETRLVQRWLDHGLNEDDARARAMGNDIPNARIVLSRSSDPSIQITPDAFTAP